MLVTGEANRRYLSGFTGTAATLLISEQDRRLVTDSRYTVQARQQAAGYDVIENVDTLGVVAAWVGERGIGQLGVESEHTSLKQHRELVDRLARESQAAAVKPLDGQVESQRIAKDEAERASSVQYVKDCITMVKELDGHEISIAPGTVGKVDPDSTPENEWNWAVESMREIYEHGQAAGVLLAIEPINRFETYFINRGAQALALAEATGRDCGVCLDAFHMNMEDRDLLGSIRQAGSRVVDFHVADSNRMAAGMGALDWAAIVRTLREVGYDGALTVEFVASIDRTPANRHPNAVETEPTDITPEQKKFIEDHGSNLLSDEFYTMLTRRSAEELLPLIR